jgi:hypothetical protein
MKSRILITLLFRARKVQKSSDRYGAQEEAVVDNNTSTTNAKGASPPEVDNKKPLPQKKPKSFNICPFSHYEHLFCPLMTEEKALLRAQS